MMDVVEGSENVVRVEALWMQANMQSPLTEDVLNEYKSELQKVLVAKGFTIARFETGIQFGVKLEAIFRKEVEK
jgi:hypothetical protein